MSSRAIASRTSPRSHAPVRTVVVQRAGGGVRRLTELSPRDARGYAVAVRAVAGGVEASLGQEVVANRVVPSPSGGLRLEPFPAAHIRWRRRLGRELAQAEVRIVLRSDVASCYPSIGSPVVVRSLLDLGASREQACAIGGLLERWGDEGVEGLPIGPAPSAVLANAVLHRVDAAFRAAGVSHLRWVDDIVAFAPDRAAILRSFDAYRRALDAVGLRLHEDKTAFVDDPVEAASMLRARASTTAVRTVR